MKGPEVRFSFHQRTSPNKLAMGRLLAQCLTLGKGVLTP